MRVVININNLKNIIKCNYCVLFSNAVVLNAIYHLYQSAMDFLKHVITFIIIARNTITYCPSLIDKWLK